MQNVAFTKREEELMNFLWSVDEPLTGKQILERCTDRSWSDTYLHVMIRSLLSKEAIESCGLVQYVTQYARKFRPIITKEEYYVQLAISRGVDPLPFLRQTGNVVIDVATKGSKKLLKEKLERLIQEIEVG